MCAGALARLSIIRAPACAERTVTEDLRASSRVKKGRGGSRVVVAITPAARPAAAASALEAPTAIMGLSLKVDSKTSVAGKTIALVVARAGVEDKIALSEGAAAIALDAGADGQLEGLATVAKYVASLSADAAALDGTTPEEQATVAEWCQRAVAEYGATGAVTDDKLEALDAHLLKRSYVATPGGLSLADLLVYGAVHGSVVALSADKLAAMCNLARWCDHVGAVSGGDATFGKIPIVRVAKLVLSTPVPDKKEKEKGGDKKGRR